MGGRTYGGPRVTHIRDVRLGSSVVHSHSGEEVTSSTDVLVSRLGIFTEEYPLRTLLQVSRLRTEGVTGC